jgi:hypothetical protein
MIFFVGFALKTNYIEKINNMQLLTNDHNNFLGTNNKKNT